MFGKMFSRFSRYYCMIELLPKYSQDVMPCSLLTDTTPHEWAIILQGPVLNGFTAESVRVYRKLYPKACLIVSTWENTDTKLAQELREVADEVILNEIPKTSGIVNVNYQGVSSYAGMKRAHELGIAYAAKTRTDMRIYAPLAFEYMKTLLDVFPVDRKYQHVQDKRIITLESAGLYRAYFLSDFFFFGATTDLMTFFDFPRDYVHYASDTRKRVEDAIRQSEKWRERLTVPVEIYMWKHYILRTDPSVHASTVKSYWDDVRARFLTLSIGDMRLYWDKHGMGYDRYCNFWATCQDQDLAQMKNDEERRFNSFSCVSMLGGHLLYDSRMEARNSQKVESLYSLGTFCNGYEHLDEVMEDIPILREIMTR